MCWKKLFEEFVPRSWPGWKAGRAGQQRLTMCARLRACALSGIVIFASGCRTNVVMLDSQKDVVRLGDDVSGHVYTWQDGKWVLSGNKVRLPQGWYAGPGPGGEK